MAPIGHRLPGTAPVLTAALAGLLLACDSGISNPGVDTVCRGDQLAPAGSIVFEQDTHTLRWIDATVTLRAKENSDSQFLDGATLRWSSSDPSVVVVGDQGQVTAVSQGTTTVGIEAVSCLGTATAKAVVEVRQDPDRIAVFPEVLDLNADESATVEANVLDAAGHPIPDEAVRFTSDNPGVAVVDNEGMVTALDSGEVEIEVSAASLRRWVLVRAGKRGGKKGSISTVEASESRIAFASLGETRDLSAFALDDRGSRLANVKFDWSSTRPSVAAVTSAGRVTAGRAGDAQIIVREQGLRNGPADTVAVVVRQVPATVGILPSTLTLGVGDQGAVEAQVDDARGNAIPDASVTWRSRNSGVASVSAGGLVRGVAAGSTTIEASAGGITGTASVRVSATPPTLLGLDLNPSSVTLDPGETQDYRAEARYSDGTTTTASAQFSASGGTIVGGRYTAGSRPGQYRVIARTESGNHADTASVTIRAARVASISASPTQVTLTSLGQGRSLSATAEDGSGTEMSGVDFAWRSTRASVATIDASGRVIARGPGSARIIVSEVGLSDGPADTVEVEVRQDPYRLAVTPSSVRLDVGDQSSLRGQVEDARGNVISGATVSWRSRNTGIASVSSSGVARGLAEGTATVEASSGGIVGTASVTVDATAPTMVGLELSPASVSLDAGGVQDFRAEARYSDGSSSAISAQFSATGGAVTDGRYIAGSTPGQYRVIARTGSGAHADTSSVTIRAPRVSTITASPSQATLTSLGQSQTLSATARDGGGSQISGVDFAWRSTRTAVATVDGSGRVTARGIGTTQIVLSETGSSGGPADTVQVEVRQDPSRVLLSPSSVSLNVGDQSTLQARVEDARGNTIAGASVSWRSRNGGVASVGSSGLVRGVAAGTATIEASSAGVIGTASVRVEAVGQTADPLFEEDFEGSLSSAIFTGNLCCSSNSFAMENGVSRTGNRSARMRLRRSDPMVNDGMRSELSMSSRNDFSGGAGVERWFGVSLRPEAGWRIDPDLTVVTWQVAAVPDAGERWRPPVLQIDITGNRWNFKVSADANRITDRTYSRETVWSDNVDFGDWTDFVVHVRYEYDNSGLLELWKDGQKVLTYRGPTAYNDGGMNYFNKTGLYIFDWNYSSGPESYTINVDSWKISDQNGGYSAVAPGR